MQRVRIAVAELLHYLALCHERELARCLEVRVNNREASFASCCCEESGRSLQFVRVGITGDSVAFVFVAEFAAEQIPERPFAVEVS